MNAVTAPREQGSGFASEALAWARRHPDLVCLLVLLIIGGGMRLAFAFRAPPLFIGGDSQTYLVPGYELARGLGFAPILKRPPLYPLFVAFSMTLMGEDPLGLVFLQHVVGLGTVVVTYWLARAVFSAAGGMLAGRVAGIVAGLLVALNGTLIIYERFVMAETLFTFLLTAAALALVLGMQRASWRLYALGGLLLALASMNRAAAQLLLPLVPLAALLWHRSLRPAARLSAATLAGFLVISLPWMTLTWTQTGSFGASGLGEALFWRGSREQPTLVKLPTLISREVGRPSDVADPTMTQARRVAYNRVFEDELPSDIAVLLTTPRFGYTEAQADAILRDVAVELFARQPELYVRSSLVLFGELLIGTEQFLGGQGKSGGVTRFPNAQDKYDFWNERIRHLAQPATTAQANEFRAAQRVVNIFQPFRYAPLLLGLLVIGMLAATFVRGWRIAWLPIMLGLWLLLTTAFLSGALPRYRYPADPLLAVGMAGGAAAVVVGARRLLMIRRAPSSSPAVPTPASTSPSAVVGR